MSVSSPKPGTVRHWLGSKISETEGTEAAESGTAEDMAPAYVRPFHRNPVVADLWNGAGARRSVDNRASGDAPDGHPLPRDHRPGGRPLRGAAGLDRVLPVRRIRRPGGGRMAPCGHRLRLARRARAPSRVHPRERHG